jgi:sugar lactone lactonase YvrE
VGPLVSSIATDLKGNVVLAEANGTRVDTYSDRGTLIWRTGKPFSVTSPKLPGYTAVGVDSRGNTAFLTYPQNAVKIYSPSGRLIHSWCAVCDIPVPNSPAQMAVSPAGNVYIAVLSQIVEFTPAGVPIHSWSGKTVSRLGPLLDIGGLAIDRRGNLYLTELDQNALEVFSPSGNLLASWKGFGSNAAGASDLGPVTVDPQGDIFVIVGKSVQELAPLR